MTQVRARLAAGETVLGCFVKHPAPGIVEVLGFLGWDVIVVDAEHGAIDRIACENMVRAAEAGGAAAVVRIPAIERAPILQALDFGAQGIQAPLVGSSQDAADVVSYARYAPDGSRGLGSVRALSYGLEGSLAASVAAANERTLIVCQIETAAGVEAVNDICGVPRVDVIFVGPTDLGLSLGVVGQPEHPTLVTAIDRVANAALGAEKTFGILVANETDAVAWERRGARYLCFNVESLLQASTQNVRAAMQAIRTEQHVERVRA